MTLVLEKDTDVFRRFMGPHGSQMENAALQGGRVTDYTLSVVSGKDLLL